jgi:hypothetical protein
MTPIVVIIIAHDLGWVQHSHPKAGPKRCSLPISVPGKSHIFCVGTTFPFPYPSICLAGLSCLLLGKKNVVTQEHGLWFQHGARLPTRLTLILFWLGWGPLAPWQWPSVFSGLLFFF